MGNIKLNIATILSSSDQIKNAKNNISSVTTSVSTIQRQMDSRILNRNNISGKMNSLSSNLSKIGNRISAIDRTVNNSVNLYYQTDNTIKRWGKDASLSTSGKRLVYNSNASNQGFFADWIKEKLKEYKDIIDSKDSVDKKNESLIGWFNSLRKDADGYKNLVSWFFDAEINYPSFIKDGLKFIKCLDIGVKLGPGIVNWADGLYSKDIDKAIEGGKNVSSAVFSMMENGTWITAVKENSFLLKPEKYVKDLKLSFEKSLLISYGKNMVSNWLDSIKSETKTSEVYWNTFANSAVSVFSDTVCNTPTLAIAYLPAQKLASYVGFDLQGAYENVSDKKGFAAVTDSFEQLGTLFTENSTWANWKSGMSVIGNKISEIFTR